jgi:predicted nuclease of predicted toxin-antitoxin system
MTRLLADENVSRHIVRRLVSAGADVTWVRTVQPGASDEAVLKIACDEGRVLVTEDRDFGELIVRRRLNAVGVVLLELDPLSGDAAAGRVAKVVAEHAEKLVGNLTVIEPGRTRIRPLLFDAGNDH